MDTEIIRMYRGGDHPSIFLYPNNPLIAAIFEVRSHGWHDCLFNPEMKDKPEVMLYKNTFVKWMVICDWVIKDRLKLFNLCDSPSGEKHMLLLESEARIAIQELNLMEGIFDAFGSIRANHNPPWKNPIAGWAAVQIEKKTQELNDAVRQIGIRKSANELRRIETSLEDYKNPFLSTRKNEHRNNMFAFATSIASHEPSRFNEHKSRVKKRFRDIFFEPYLKALGDHISSYRYGITLDDGVCHRISNIYLSKSGNSIKITDKTGKPENIFPKTMPRSSLTQRGKYPRA
jgi:hypothetical protein